MTKTENCKNCNEILLGTYCHHCGEKSLEERDFHLRTLISQTIDGIFNLDSKVFKSFHYLLLRPGILSKRYVEGIRKPFMKPIQMFLLINVLFFLLLTKADILRIPSAYYFQDKNQIELTQMSTSNGVSEKDLKHRFDLNSATYSKAGVIFLIPFFALVFWIVNYQKHYSFGKHNIFAIHYFSFFMVFCVMLIFISGFGNIILQSIIVLTNFIYLFFSFRAFYNDSILIALPKAGLSLLMSLMLILLYRRLISDVTFYFMP